MRSILQPKKGSLPAAQVVEPFLHGEFHWSSGASVRIRGLRRRPRGSVAHFGETFLIATHRPVTLLGEGDPEAAELDSVFGADHAGTAFDLGRELPFVRLVDRSIARSSTPKAFPS